MIRRFVLPGLTILGVTALVALPLLRPDRANHPRDPIARAVLDLTAITPGMVRDVVDKQAVFVLRRPDGVEVFRHPKSEFLRIDLRFTDERVTAVGEPYLAHFPQPKHLP